MRIQPGENTPKEVTQPPKQDPATEENNKTVSKEILLQRRISARTRASAEKEKEDKEQKEVNFAEEPQNNATFLVTDLKSSNMKKNLDCNNIIGHSMIMKEERHTMILILNPNGISMNNNCEQHQEICDAINKNNIDYFGCSEINLDTTQQYVQQTIKKITNAAFLQSSIQISNTPIPAKYYFKPGGTMCIAQGDINSRKLEQG
eukprot:11562092-Ditylum_brightwellii.AAC.1